MFCFNPPIFDWEMTELSYSLITPFVTGMVQSLNFWLGSYLSFNTSIFGWKEQELTKFQSLFYLVEKWHSYHINHSIVG